MDYLLRLLNVRRNEVPRLALASAVFFLAQVDDGIVKSVASAVFNVRAGVEKLPLMYTWIAVVFSLSMAFLSWLTSKVARQRLLLGLMVFVASVLTANALLLLYEYRSAVGLGTEAYSFIFISSELARTLMNFQIWIVAGGICYTSRAKILFPLLASSAVLGDIAGGFTVQLLSGLFAAHALYALAVGNMVVVLFLLRLLLRRYFVVQEESEDEAGATMGENIRFFAGSPYLILLFVLSIAVFALYTAIHYGFNVIGRQHFATESEITEFFGLFFGLTGIATLFVTTFLLQRLLRWLGTRNIYFWVGLVYALISGLLLSAFENALPLSVITAIFAANLLNYVLLDSIIAPAYQVLIKLVPARNSDGTRMIMEGGFMLLGGLAGAGITSLHADGTLNLSELFIALIVLAGCMVVCGMLLRKSYTAVLVRAVREQNFDPEDEQAMQSLRGLIANSPDFSRGLLLHREDGVRQLGIEMLRENPGPAGELVCVELLGHDNARIRAAALTALYPQHGQTPSRELVGVVLSRLRDEDNEVRLAAVRCLVELLDDRVKARDGLLVGEAVAEELFQEGQHAAMQAQCLIVLELLEHDSSTSSRAKILDALLASEDPEALIAGIEAAGSAEDPALVERLVTFLESGHPAVREAAVHSLGQIGTENSFNALRLQLNDPDPDVVDTVVQALKTTAESDRRQRLISDLKSASLREWQGLMSALMAMDDHALDEALLGSCRIRLVEANRYIIALNTAKNWAQDGAAELLADQLYAEAQAVRDTTVRVLGHLGDTGVVGDLVERLGGKDAGARDNAIELLENIAESELLAHLLPLLESDPSEQFHMAEGVIQWEAVDVEQVLDHLLRNGGVWTQVATVWVAVQWGHRSLCQEVGDQIAATAQEILAETDDAQGESLMNDEIQPLTTMEKITFLRGSSFFASLPLEELYHVALSIEEESVKVGEAVIREGTMGDKMYIVVSGELEVKKDGGPRLAVLGEKQVFGDMALLDDEPRSASVVAIGEVHLLSLQRSNLERILRRYASISFNMMRILSHRLREAQAS